MGKWLDMTSPKGLYFSNESFPRIMKKVIIACFVLVGTWASGQILSVTPAFPSQNDTVEIIYDATEGNGALTGISPVYAHAGLITNQSTSPTDWKHVQGNWGQAHAKVLMTALGNNKHKITYHMPTFYGFGSSVQVQKMAFVFRNANGSIVGRSADGSDIFYDIYPPTAGYLAKFLSPTSTQALPQGDSLYVVVASNRVSTFTVTDNGTQVFQDSTTKQEGFWLQPSGVGNHELIMHAQDTSGSVYDTLRYVVNPGVPIAPLPAGALRGLNELNDSTVLLVLHAPYKNYAYVLNSLNNFEPDTAYYMNKTPDGQHLWVEMRVPAGQEFMYQYWVDSDVRIADPFSEVILDRWNDGYIPASSYPNLPAYPVQYTSGHVTLAQTAKTPYNWVNNNFQAPPKEELLIYELLIRDFATVKNYQTLIDTLDYLDRLGINAIELMPNTEFEGNSSWGYNPSYQMALDKYYGTPDMFKAFVDSCHGRGIAVIMDMVYNHAYGQNPIAQLWWDAANNQPASNNPYMNATCPHPPNCWGNDFNHNAQATKDYIDRINTHFIEHYKIDGIRFDFTKGFTNSSNADNYQQGRINLLKRMADTLWALDSDFYVILEHWGPNNEEQALSNHGMLLWGNATHAYNEAAMGYISGSNFEWGIAKQRGWADHHLISYMESHDEERMAYKLKTYGNSNGTYDTRSLATRSDRIILSSAFFYTLPGPKMLWMFGELGYDISIDDPCRICEKPILWQYYNDQARQKVYFYMASLMHMRNTYNTFHTTNYSYALSGTTKRINLNDANMNATVIGNFGITSQQSYPNFQHPGTWYNYFTGDSITVVNTNDPIQLAAGEWRIYTDVKVAPAAFMGADEITGSDWTPVLFPNPADAMALIDLKGAAQAQITLTSSMGQVVIERTCIDSTAPEIIDLTSLASGVYLVQVKSEKGVWTTRLVH